MLDLTSLFSSDLSECSLLNSCDYANGGNRPPQNGLIRNEIPPKCHHYQGIKKEKHASLAWNYENHLHFSSNGESMRLMKQYQICVDDFKLLSVWLGVGVIPRKL